MTNSDLQKAKEVMEAHGFTVVMPGLMTHTVEKPATADEEMERALASSHPGGDLAMASQAGLALAIGELGNRLTVLENSIVNLARATVGKESADPLPHVEHEPEPIDAVEVDAELAPRVERGADGLPNLSTTDPMTICTCKHSRLRHLAMTKECHTPFCGCRAFVEHEGLIS